MDGSVGFVATPEAHAAAAELCPSIDHLWRQTTSAAGLPYPERRATVVATMRIVQPPPITDFALFGERIHYRDLRFEP
jgi:hypothetical protein